MKKKVLCILRVSTIRQEIESQKSDMINFLISKGYSEDEIDWLESKGASARCANKAYLKMLDDIKSIISSSDSINACAVWHLNRLGRIESYIYMMKDWFVQNRIQLYVKNPDITLLNSDLSYNVGNNIIFSVFSAMIPAETAEMMEKFRRGKQRRKEQGKYIGGFVPFGFKIVDGYYTPDEEKMDFVKKIFNAYATGKYSYITLQELFKDNEFSVRHIALLLNNDMYKEHVGVELWNECQKVKSKNSLGYNNKTSKYSRLSARLIKCPYCGYGYISDSRSYVCINRKQGRRYNRTCPDSVSISCDVLDMVVWNEVIRLHRRFLLGNDKTAVEENNKKKRTLQKQIEEIDSKISKLKEKVDRVYELYIEGDVDKNEYKTKKNKAEKDRISLEGDRDNLQNDIKEIDEKLAILEGFDIKEQMKMLISDCYDKRKLIEMHIKKIELKPYIFNDRTCIFITIYDYYEHYYEFIYDYNADKRNKLSIFNKVFRIKNGKVTKYSYSGRSMEDIGDSSLKRAIELLNESGN